MGSYLAPIHKPFGGRILYLPSGGERCAQVKRDCTLWAPSAGTANGSPTVSRSRRPRNQLLLASVGTPLRVELRSDDPAEQGVARCRSADENIRLYRMKILPRADQRWMDRNGDLGRATEAEFYVAGTRSSSGSDGPHVYQILSVYEMPFIKEFCILGAPGTAKRWLSCVPGTTRTIYRFREKGSKIGSSGNLRFRAITTEGRSEKSRKSMTGRHAQVRRRRGRSWHTSTSVCRPPPSRHGASEEMCWLIRVVAAVFTRPLEHSGDTGSRSMDSQLMYVDWPLPLRKPAEPLRRQTGCMK